MPTPSKPSNPKDAIATGTRLPIELVPDVVKTEAAFAFLEGALKYGRFNWRAAGVRASVYKAAIERHLAKWWNGEDYDRRTRVKHLASIIASVGILLDAELCGMLTDDRPPEAPMSARIDEAEELVKHLKELFKGYNPYQYTIKDTKWPQHQRVELRPTSTRSSRPSKRTSTSRSKTAWASRRSTTTAATKASTRRSKRKPPRKQR